LHRPAGKAYNGSRSGGSRLKFEVGWRWSQSAIMSGKVKSGGVLLLLALAGAAVCWWVHDAPRRTSLDCLARLDTALHSGNRAELLDLVVMPAAVQDESWAEQLEFLGKALGDEISPAGLAVLKRHATYGPLKELFPAEAVRWASQARVDPDDCVAFKLERHGQRAEVVLVKLATPKPQPLGPPLFYQVVRLNNVKQMADSTLLTTEKTQ
jgi:hypothetical protein